MTVKAMGNIRGATNTGLSSARAVIGMLDPAVVHVLRENGLLGAPVRSVKKEHGVIIQRLIVSPALWGGFRKRRVRQVKMTVKCVLKEDILKKYALRSAQLV